MKNRYLMPITVVIAAAIVAAAVYTIEKARHPGSTGPTIFDTLTLMRPVDSTDHILGNPGAPVVIVEYGDIDCPFCKDFHETMEQVMATYGPTGEVAWVFRHFPIVGLHPYAEQHAEAAECAASLGGQSAFWKFIDAVHAAAPGANQFDPAGYDAIIESLGLPTDQFNACMAAGTFKEVVAEDYQNAIDSGGTGTPFSIVLTKGQPPLPLDGALSYDSMKSLIDESLAAAHATP